MSRAENVILTNMVMVYNEHGEILVQQKVDDDWTGLCFPGGHVEKLFKTNQFSGEIVSSDEGEVFWINPEKLSEYQLAVSFMEMYKVFTSDDISEQYSYQDGDQVIRALY